MGWYNNSYITEKWTTQYSNGLENEVVNDFVFEPILLVITMNIFPPFLKDAVNIVNIFISAPQFVIC